MSDSVAALSRVDLDALARNVQRRCSSCEKTVLSVGGSRGPRSGELLATAVGRGVSLEAKPLSGGRSQARLFVTQPEDGAPRRW